MSIKVILADDHASLRKGFRALLESAGDFEILCETGSGGEAVARARELEPDIVVMDVAMPGINGIDATRQIIAGAAPVRVLALSGHNDGIFIRQMLEAGARGYLLKDVAATELVAAVQAVAEGRIYVSPSVVDTLTYSFLSTMRELQSSREKQQQLLDEIRVQNQELERQNAELERFTYSVSHDLKTPLVTIRGFIGLLQRDLAAGDDEAIATDIDKITRATDNMARQLDELLELSRVGRVVSTPITIDLDEMVAEVLDLFRETIATRGIRIEIPRSMPAVSGDAGRIFEIYQNLIGNAIKFGRDGVESCIAIGAERDGDRVTCFVRDNGIGIETRYLQRIFNLFERLDAEIDGTGIGLALVKRIVEFHDGRIWAESAGPGEGTAFWFTLPAAAEDA
ncbi:MAG: response regulator [Gammaproteobacteria bacterium]|nr:response regulator [Gammaproteobacteria bacterium]